MAGLSDQKMEIVRRLVEQAGDTIVGNLSSALASSQSDSLLGGVQTMVEAELADRRLRDAVFSPVASLFVGGAQSAERLTFPRRALGLIWRALKCEAKADVAAAATEVSDFKPHESSARSCDLLMTRAAEGLRQPERPEFAEAVAILNAARPNALSQLLICLDIAPVVREACLCLSDWTLRSNDAHVAAARISYSDAVAIHDEAGPCYYEMLAAKLPHPWMVLRIISAAMDRPPEGYVAGSEVDFFPLRYLDQIDANLKRVDEFNPGNGLEAGAEMGQVVELITRQISEVETTIELSREGPWGLRVQKQKKALAQVVENRLWGLEKAIAILLPNHMVRVGKANRSVPKLDHTIDAAGKDCCVCLISFAESVRTSANYGGFASARAKMLEKVGENLDDYVQEVLSQIRDDRSLNLELADKHLACAADLVTLIRDERAGDVVRRRAATALSVANATDSDLSRAS